MFKKDVLVTRFHKSIAILAYFMFTSLSLQYNKS